MLTDSVIDIDHKRRFGSLSVLVLASTCKEYAAGLAREVRRATALALPRHERDRFGRCRFGYPQGHIISFFTSKAVVASANRLTDP